MVSFMYEVYSESAVTLEGAESYGVAAVLKVQHLGIYTGPPAIFLANLDLKCLFSD